MTLISPYYNSDLVDKQVRAGAHRGLIGGMWDEIGALQFDYVRTHGLARDMRFLDIGCGCLRGGLHFINYLEAGHYYGIDLSQAMLDVGYDTELKQVGLQHKLPRQNLHCTGEFDVAHFGIRFDMALALSVFTHLPIEYLRPCLDRLADVIEPGGRFFATVFLCPDGHDWNQKLPQRPGDIITYPDRNPYHYRIDDLKSCYRGSLWKLETLEDWNHPRNQWMAVFVRAEDTT